MYEFKCPFRIYSLVVENFEWGMEGVLNLDWKFGRVIMIWNHDLGDSKTFYYDNYLTTRFY